MRRRRDPRPELGVDPPGLSAKGGGEKRLDGDSVEDLFLDSRPDSGDRQADGGKDTDGGATGVPEAGGPFAVDGLQCVVGEEVLEDRLGVDSVDPLHESRGDDALLDDSGLLRIGGSGYYRSLCKIVGGRLPLVVGDVHEEVGKGV